MDNNEDKLEIIKTIQKAVEQMKIDDIEEASDHAYETFQCQCCGQEKIIAGSLVYDGFVLCNDCVLLAEVGLALKKFDNISTLLDSMEDKRFEYLYSTIFDEQKKENDNDNKNN